MSFLNLRVRVSCAIVLFSILGSTSASLVFAQNRDIGARRLILDDNAGNTLTISYAGGSSGTFVLPSGPSTTVASGTLSGQTLRWNGTQWIASSSLMNDGTDVTLTGDLKLATGKGIMINNTAASGQYLRGDGTRFVSSAIQAADLPAGSGSYIQNQNAGPQASADFNISGSGSVGGLIQGTGGLLLNGTTGTTPTSGAGTRLMWIPAKGAFRAGIVGSNQWDDANVGSGSFATGINTKASGLYSTAMGYGTTASAAASTAMGGGTTASASFSTAMGDATTASGFASTAMGNTTIASGDYATAMGSSIASGVVSTAMGYATKAGGFASTAMGQSTTASGDDATAMGSMTTASGHLSTAMGSYVSTNSMIGSFIYGDNSSGGVSTSNTANHQFMVRAAGGTVFYSSADLSTGVTLAAGGNSWASISDSNKKANRLNIDGESVLSKLSNIWLGSWNYKSQDKSMRHYGPMAQEFFAAFGNDGMGIIGNDTTLATADVDGVTLIAVKALEARTAALQSANAELTDRVTMLEAVIRKMAVSQDATIQKAVYKK